MTTTTAANESRIRLYTSWTGPNYANITLLKFDFKLETKIFMIEIPQNISSLLEEQLSFITKCPLDGDGVNKYRKETTTKALRLDIKQLFDLTITAYIPFKVKPVQEVSLTFPSKLKRNHFYTLAIISSERSLSACLKEEQASPTAVLPTKEYDTTLLGYRLYLLKDGQSLFPLIIKQVALFEGQLLFLKKINFTFITKEKEKIDYRNFFRAAFKKEIKKIEKNELEGIVKELEEKKNELKTKNDPPIEHELRREICKILLRRVGIDRITNSMHVLLNWVIKEHFQQNLPANTEEIINQHTTEFRFYISGFEEWISKKIGLT